MHASLISALRMLLCSRLAVPLALCSACYLPIAAGEETITSKRSTPGLLDLFPKSSPTAESVNTYRVQQIVRLSEIEPGAKRVRMWISLPGDEANQKLLNMVVETAPGDWKFVRDADSRGQFLAIEVADPQSDSLEVKVSFEVRRQPVYTAVDPERAGPMDETLKSMLAEHLVLDAPHMEVTDEFRAIADKVCGDETNIAVQARLLLQHVASTVDHYSYSTDPNMPTCGIGDAAICKKQGGGCCTDLNSYFIALARSRGIAARLNMGYRLQEKNAGQWADPGYRCWVEYFVPDFGWISADVVEADTPSGLGHERWLSGLTSRRIWLNQGREFNFGDDLAVGRVNHMSIGYAEVDGKPVRLLPEGDLLPQLTRKVHFTESETATGGE